MRNENSRSRPRAGDIGEPVKEIEFEPLDDPIEAPVPSAPAPVKAPEPVPA